MHVFSCAPNRVIVMKFAPLFVAAAVVCSGAAWAQGAAAPASTGAAAVHAVCKDGPPFEGAKLSGLQRIVENDAQADENGEGMEGADGAEGADDTPTGDAE